MERGAEWDSDGTWPAEARAGVPARNEAQGEGFGYCHALQRMFRKAGAPERTRDLPF